MSEGLLLPWALGGFSAGSRVAGYRLEAQIGQGGMAIVFRAYDERLNRQVALKILAPVLAADVAFRQRFIRESQAAAAVDDPHIIPVFEAGEAAGILFIAMRLVRGGDLRSLVATHGPLAPARVEWIVSAVASALDAAHSAGLVHRDVKPANMLLDRRPARPDHVYLSDFGLSKDALGASSLTGSGHFVGTVDYAAPEQIEGRDVDGRTDEYALGCSAFELLCGRPPFRRDQGLAAIYAHLSEQPPSLTALRAGLPSRVDSVFAKVLAKAQGDRYASCQEFAEHLRDALGIPPYATDGIDGHRERSVTDIVLTRPSEAADQPAGHDQVVVAEAGRARTGRVAIRPIDQRTTGLERHTRRRGRARYARASEDAPAEGADVSSQRSAIVGRDAADDVTAGEVTPDDVTAGEVTPDDVTAGEVTAGGVAADGESAAEVAADAMVANEVAAIGPPPGSSRPGASPKSSARLPSAMTCRMRREVAARPPRVRWLPTASRQQPPVGQRAALSWPPRRPARNRGAPPRVSPCRPGGGARLWPSSRSQASRSPRPRESSCCRGRPPRRRPPR